MGVYHFNMLNTKSNLAILQDIKKEYEPNNAFGNIKLIELLNSIRYPNKKGEFEVYADVREVKICRLNWECVDCGIRHIENVSDSNVQEGDVIRRICSCGKKHQLTVVN